MKPLIRALFFDAGNTLLRINYAAIAEQLALRGIRKSHEAVAQAEYRARVQLDPHLAPGSSTESRSVAGYYFRYVLEELGITDPETVQAVAEWRKEYNPPVGLWHIPDPEAETALRLARDTGCVAGVISNSNGSVRSILEETGPGAPPPVHPGLRRGGHREARPPDLSHGACGGARGARGSRVHRRPLLCGRPGGAGGRDGSGAGPSGGRLGRPRLPGRTKPGGRGQASPRAVALRRGSGRARRTRSASSHRAGPGSGPRSAA